MKKRANDHVVLVFDLNGLGSEVDGRVAHVEALQCLDENVSDKEVAVPLAIRRNHVPGSVVSAGF